MPHQVGNLLSEHLTQIFLFCLTDIARTSVRMLILIHVLLTSDGSSVYTQLSSTCGGFKPVNGNQINSLNNWISNTNTDINNQT